MPAYYGAGFHPGPGGHAKITAYMPYGNSVYHGWANQLTRRFNNGLQFIGSYTWSHAIDDSTADVFSTVTTPRRPEDSQNLRIDRSSSALDHRQRLSFQLLYDVPFFKHSNWFLKGFASGWELAPIYTYQTGTLWTPQSGVDSNLNGDHWPDRTIVNPNGGDPSMGSTVTPLTNSAGQTVGYVVDNPAAAYAQAPRGTLSNGGRNTEHFNPINDIDVTAAKRVYFTERMSIQFSARMFNVLNHPQYAGGFLNDVAPIGYTGGNALLFTQPQSPFFNQLGQVFSSNPRSMVLALKFIF